MIAVSDTSPVNYLILLGEIEVLGALFDRVALPVAVSRELSHPEAPPSVREWILEPPDWVHRHPDEIPGLGDPGIGAGESEAIALAVRLAALLLVDDFEARRVAVRCGLRVVGTLGILERAAASGILSLPEALDKLRGTNFRLSERVIEAALDRDRRRG